MGKKTWTEEDETRLIDLYPLHTQQELSSILGRTVGSIRNRCLKLGLNSKKRVVQDMTGMQIGPLIILGHAAKTDGNRSTRWLCRCVLSGNEFSVNDYWLNNSDPYGHCTCTKYKKFSGANNPSYKHGGVNNTLYKRF